MGWPRKNEGVRLYFERRGKSYLLVFQGKEYTNYQNMQECIGELLINNNPERPMLCTSSVSPNYLYSNCRRASWDEMPEIWKNSLQECLHQNPEEIRGLWRIKN